MSAFLVIFCAYYVLEIGGYEPYRLAGMLKYLDAV